VSLNFSKSLSTLIFGIATVLLGLGSMLGNLWGGMIHDYTQSFLPIYQISTITAFVLALLALVLGRFSEYKNHHL
jgi:predicted MFS family arabinose efflux permease